jgi:hypothetical protein
VGELAVVHDLDEGRRLKEEGIAGVQRSAGDWNDEALAAVQQYSTEHVFFNMDHVTDRLPRLPKGVSTSVKSTVLRRAAGKKFQYCYQTDYTTVSDRPERHASSLYWYVSRLHSSCDQCEVDGVMQGMIYDFENEKFTAEFCNCALANDSLFIDTILHHWDRRIK